MADLDFLIFSSRLLPTLPLLPLAPFASVFISASLLHAFVPELTLARPGFDLLISPYKQVRAHTHTAWERATLAHTQTGTHKRTNGCYIKQRCHPAAWSDEQICHFMRCSHIKCMCRIIRCRVTFLIVFNCVSSVTICFCAWR